MSIPAFNLPEAERFLPETPADAMLVFGEIALDDTLNYGVATDTLPGTPDRIEIYRQRAAARQPIFHSSDRNTYEGLGIKKGDQYPTIRQIIQTELQKRR